MRCVLLATLLLLASMPRASAARSSDVRKVCRAFIERVAPRQGVHYRSLVLVPLVAKSKTPTGTIKILAKERAWTPVGDLAARGEARLQPGKSTQAASQAACLLPSGLLMKRGVDERLVRHPLLASPARAGGIRTVALGSPADEAAAEATSERGTFGRIAPPEFRQVLFQAGDGKVLKDLLALEATLVGLAPDKKPRLGLSAIYEAKDVAAKIEAATRSLRPIAKAYGGQTLGHLAYLGNRPIELVLASTPAQYAAYVERAVEGLALAVIVWEELYGRVGDPIQAPHWPSFLEAGERALRPLRSTLAKQKPISGGDAIGELWRLRAASRWRDKSLTDVGWLLLDTEGHPLWLEAWPDSTVRPLPPPSEKPGGRGTSEDPYDRKGGAMTRMYLERFLKRLKERRRKIKEAAGGR